MAAWVLLHALAIGTFAIACFGAGRAVLSVLSVLWRIGTECPPGQRAAFSIGLGMGLVGTALFVLAAAGQLTRNNVIALILVLVVAGLLSLRRHLRFRREGALLIASTATSFLLALYPPTGFDATMYHLAFARAFASAGSLVFADTLRFPVFPQLGEMSFAAALLAADDTVAQLTQWLALVVTAVAAASLAHELGGRPASALAAALWIGSPLALYLGASGYIDASLAMFVTLAFAAWHRYRSDPRLIGWAALAGAFAGCAAATKYHGLFVIAALGLAAARRGTRTAALFGLTAALFAAPWYVRITASTGNPVFPYASAIFGRHEWQTRLDARLEGALAGQFPGAGQTLADPVVHVARRAVFDRIANGEAPHNPWLLVLLPFAAAAAIVEPRLRFPCLCALGYAAVVWTLDWRFMIAIAPILSIAIAVGITRAWVAVRAPRPAAIATVALMLAAPGLGWTSLLLLRFGPIPTTETGRDVFLERRIPVYEALRFLARERPDAVVYLLHGENAAYYCPARCMGEHYGPYRYALVDPLLARPPELAARLRGFGADTLVRRTGAPPLDADGSGAFRLLFRGRRAEAYELRRPP